jgi:hypothetical protein
MDIFDGAFRSIRYARGVMFGLTALVVLVTQGIVALVTWRFFESTNSFTSPTLLTTDSSGYNVMLFLAGLGVSLLIDCVAFVILFGLLTFSVSQATIGHRTSIRQAWTAVRARVPALFGLTLLLGLIGTAAIFVPFLVLIVIIAMGGGESVGYVLAALFVSGVTLLFSLWLVYKLIFAPIVLVLEGLGPKQAIKRSWTITKGCWWRVFGISTLTQFILGAVSQIVALPTVIIGTLLTTASGSLLGIMVMELGSVLGLIFTTPFTTAVTVLLYIDRRMRTEGLDIQLAQAAAEQRS